MLYPWFCSAISQITSKARGRLSKPLLELLEPQKKVPGGPTCYSLKRPSATSALCYADVNVNGGGEGPPVLGKTSELHRISRCFFLFSKLPIPYRSEGERGKRAKWPEDTRKPTCLSVFFQFGDQISVSVTIKGIWYHQSGFPDARDKARRPLAVPVAREKDGQKDLGHRPAFGNHCTVYQRNPNRGYFEISHHEPLFRIESGLGVDESDQAGQTRERPAFDPMIWRNVTVLHAVWLPAYEVLCGCR